MRAISLLLVALLFCGCGSGDGGQTPGATPISAVELAERIASGSSPLVLDVRTREEYARGHVPGAVNIPHDELATRIDELPDETSLEIVVHCQSGRRAELAAGTLEASGYSNVRDLSGHWQGWQASGLPVE